MDGTWKGRWQRWQFRRTRRYHKQEIDVSTICEDGWGYPCIVQMEQAKRKFKFRPMDYGTVVREMVQGLVNSPPELDEWELDQTWRTQMTRSSKKS